MAMGCGQRKAGSELKGKSPALMFVFQEEEKIAGSFGASWTGKENCGCREFGGVVC